MNRNASRALVVVSIAFAACSAETPEARLEIDVAPLHLEDIGGADYLIKVDNARGETVWTKAVTSSRYGDGKGSLAYVGTCDADASPNTVSLTLESLSDANGRELTADEWVKPPVMTQVVPCAPNADTRVSFDVTVMRNASQGFFDVAVNFDDVFCSAKLDCTDLLHDASGDRAATAVVGFACTSGEAEPTWLYLDDVTIVCGDTSYTVDPGIGRGQHGPIAPGVFQTAIYAGREDLGQPSLEKCYWNTAIGLGPDLGTSCELQLVGTAAHESWVDGLPPAGVVRPVIRWTVPLTDPDGALACDGPHALGALGSGVTTAYSDTPTTPFPNHLRCADGALFGAPGSDGPLDDPPDDPDPDAVPVTTTVVAVDQDNQPIPGVSIQIDGQWVDLPTTVSGLAGASLGATALAYCGGQFPITTLTFPNAATAALSFVPASVAFPVDATTTLALATGQQTTLALGTGSALQLVLERHSPHVLWNFDTSNFNCDAIDTWCTRGNNSKTLVPNAGGVGNAASLPASGNAITTNYASLTAGGQRFGQDASLRQRDFLKAKSFTVEMMFKNYGKLFSLGMRSMLVQMANRLSILLEPAGNFRVTGLTGGDRNFNLDGLGRLELDRVVEGWHHLALTYDHVTGTLTLFLDGERYPDWIVALPPGTLMSNATNITFGSPYAVSSIYIDEWAGYVGALSPELVNRHARDALDLHQPYAACTPPRAVTAPEDQPEATVPNFVDKRHLPPGFPAFNGLGTGDPATCMATATPCNSAAARSPLQQMQSFPLPRYRPGHTLPPIGNWLGAQYISGRGQPGVSATVINQQHAAMLEELSARWNYYLLVSSNAGRETPTTNPGVVPLANAHPEWKTMAITLWAQNSPRNTPLSYWTQADLDYFTAQGWTLPLPTTPFIARSVSDANPLSIEHYINDNTNTLMTSRSPEGVQTWTIDGKVAAERVQRFVTALAPRAAAGALPIDHINENDEVVEVFSGVRSHPEIWRNDPDLLALFEDYAADQGVTNAVDHSTSPPTILATQLIERFAAYAHTLVRAAYMDEIGAVVPGASLTVYAVDGQNTYRPHYSEARFIQTEVDGSRPATPDIYSRQPKWWYAGAGAWHGFMWSGQARKLEIDSGDKLYQPFLGAGWDESPALTMLPGQWLGMTKALAILGAATWYSGFFSLQAPFPHPSGWVWQAAIPSYAQAITSRYEDLLRDGDLVQARPNWSAYSWAFKDYYSLYSVNFHDLFVARRLGDRWVIAGTAQTSTRLGGFRPLWKIGQVTLPAFESSGAAASFKLPIRRQGSVYVFDHSVSPPTLVQLDRWHEPWHPSYWRSAFTFDAEVDDGLSAAASGAAWKVHTDAPGAATYDYSDFTTSLEVSPAVGQRWSDAPSGGELALTDAPVARYIVRPRTATDLYVWVRARVRDDGDGHVDLRVGSGPAEQRVSIAVSGDTWAWYRLDDGGQAVLFQALAAATHVVPASGPHEDVEHVIEVRPDYDQIAIDQLVFAPDPADDPSTWPAESTITEQAN